MPCSVKDSDEALVDVAARADIDFVDVQHASDPSKTNRVLGFGFAPTHIAYQALQLGVRPGGEGYQLLMDCRASVDTYLLSLIHI